MVNRATYTQTERVEALTRLEMNGGNAKRTAAELGIPRATLQLWRDTAVQLAPSDDEVRAQKAAQWSSIQDLAIMRLAELVPKADSIKDLAVVAGIAADKHLDYTVGRKGTQTQVNVDARTQSLTIGADLDDDARRAILARVATSE